MDPLAQRLADLKRHSIASEDIDGSNLAQMRYQNDLHLKGTLDHIYEKYSRDFSEIGDEVDIRTGEVIVNRGHMQRMRGETDTGIGEPTGPQRSWISDLVEDQQDEEQDDDNEDELCILPSKSPKVTRSSYAPEEAVQSTEVLIRAVLSLLVLAN
jgi:hypothetical protein